MATKKRIRAAQSGASSGRKADASRALSLPELRHLKPERATEPVPEWARELDTRRPTPITARAESIIARPSRSRPRAQLSSRVHRPAWLDLDYIPCTVPHRFKLPSHIAPKRMSGRPGELALHKLVTESLTYSWPWKTIGKVRMGSAADFNNAVDGGTGVLVGPNLMLTASHITPWEFGDQGWMHFTPGYRDGMGDPRFGSSYVEKYRGIREQPSPNGFDYVICKLATPLGNNVGWMGTKWWGDEDRYYNGSWFLNGFPLTFLDGQRLAVEAGLPVEDIDNDDPGLEIEVDLHASGGWSGGPLWGWIDGEPRVVGVVSGWEVDEYDPPRTVVAGGRLLVELTQHGWTHWQ